MSHAHRNLRVPPTAGRPSAATPPQAETRITDSPITETRQREIVQHLVREHGRTFAQDAGITLADSPAPLWQLLVLVQLLSARIEIGRAHV